eukprot:TRINITY_DN9577_c0_g2_i1.p1 TRINITY_DN9577_c0_g2~~TRINITY_DN9577_c0_g2_i1.p1  ORF type:complete len:109 (-),score=4.75 TRINITY_DN9577_c0_g2_i1:679-1005(-)
MFALYAILSSGFMITVCHFHLLFAIMLISKSSRGAKGCPVICIPKNLESDMVVLLLSKTMASEVTSCSQIQCQTRRSYARTAPRFNPPQEMVKIYVGPVIHMNFNNCG